MERAEAEGKLTAKLMDMVEILHKYDDASDYLSITWNGEEKFINIHNEAFRKDVKTINLCTDAPKREKAEDVNVDLPMLFTLEDIDKAISDAVEMTKKKDPTNAIAILVWQTAGAGIKAALIKGTKS